MDLFSKIFTSFGLSTQIGIWHWDIAFHGARSYWTYAYASIQYALSFNNLVDNIDYIYREGVIRSLAILESSFIAVSELLPPLCGEPIKVVETDVPMKPLQYRTSVREIKREYFFVPILLF